MFRRAVLAASTLVAACSPGPRSGAACGIAYIAGPSSLLEQFGVPRQTLSVAPAKLPERLVVRLVAGPAVTGVVGRADSSIVIGVDGALPANAAPQFGVLVVDPSEQTRGVMLYEAPPVDGAPTIGTINIGSHTIPLLGLQVDPAKVEDAKCPYFPDSLLK